VSVDDIFLTPTARRKNLADISDPHDHHFVKIISITRLKIEFVYLVRLGKIADLMSEYIDEKSCEFIVKVVPIQRLVV